MRSTAFLPLKYFAVTLLLTFVSVDVHAAPKSCIRSVLEWLCWIETPAKSSYQFSEMELAEVANFLKQPAKVELIGFPQKFKKLSDLSIERYSAQADLAGIRAFAKMDDFHLTDAGLSANVAIRTLDEHTLIVDIPDVRVKSAGDLGRTSQRINLSLARFMATARRGIEYRLSEQPAIEKVILQPSKVVNQQLKHMLGELGFTLKHQASDFGDVRAYQSGMGPPARFELILNVVKK